MTQKRTTTKSGKKDLLVRPLVALPQKIKLKLLQELAQDTADDKEVQEIFLATLKDEKRKLNVKKSKKKNN